MDRRRVVHGENAERLQPARALQHLADHARAFIRDLIAVAAQARHMQEDIRQAIVGNDESKSLGHIEPLNDTAKLDDARRLIGEIAHRFAVGSDACAGPL